VIDMKPMTDLAVGFIPARGGSKSIPKKNLVSFAGKPLIDYVITAGQSSQQLTSLVCSTDDSEIADYCQSKGVEVDWRDDRLAQDDSHIVDVVVDFLNRRKNLPRFIVLLQPTSPIISSQQIDQAVSVLTAQPDCMSIQTVSDVPHNCHAFNQREIRDGQIHFRFEPERKEMFNKQKKPPFFIFANLVAARCSAIIEQNNMFPRPSSPIVVDRQYAFDLDTTGDIEVGECLIAARAKSNR